MKIWIVLSPGPIILAAYDNEDSAIVHCRCLRGVKVVACDVASSVPDSIRRDLEVEWASDFDEDTPVCEMPLPTTT